MGAATRRLLFLAACVSPCAAVATAADPPRFNRDVRPILADNCYACHGVGVKKAGLRLDQRETAVAKLESGDAAIVPGKLDESTLIQRILTDDPEEVMPPPSSKKTLTSEQKELLKRWIESGAVYEKHWAYQTPVKPEVPQVEGEGVRIANPIDAFIARRLRQQGLGMSPEADRETLIRRVAFALTGLPPSLAEVEMFTGDNSTSAYENMVERYLNSPRFGEEMARSWLDVARYADTHGLHLDNERQMWLYRDWVVKAFNDNKPYDQFTVEQLAGDLLPNATVDQKIATGFNRCNVTTGEGGSIETEWIFRNAVDRTSTMVEAWMGLTAGCSVCHDHKYDPLSTNEFYSLYAFFYSAAGPALDGNALLHEPSLKLPTSEQKARLAELDRQLADLKAELDRKDAEISRDAPDDDGTDPKTSFTAWLKNPSARPDAPADVKKLVNQVKKRDSEALKPEQKSKLRLYYMRNINEATAAAFKSLNDKQAELTKKRGEVDASILGTFIFTEMEKPRDSFVMMRGQYDKTGVKVEPNTPSAFPPLKKADPNTRATRLDLARWLVAPDHPLTARVAANRMWQKLFGIGLVKTSFDFGTQGEQPSHPELLDWLAVTFRENGWNLKALVKTMVTSAVFRQASRVTPEQLRIDPDNRLLSRGPRFRLDAEPIRDNALFVSGLINLQMGGRGVRPYQPPNIWEPVAYTGSNTRSYTPDTGPALYRRSVYVFFKRTAPPPYLTNFDAPSREFFCSRRERSNTPLQALQLMNDVQQVEAARALAQRMMAEGGDTPEERITWAFRTVLARRPEADELNILREEWKTHLERYNAAPTAANKLVHTGDSPVRTGLPVPELAAYTLVANTLLNLDETITPD